MRVRAFAKRNIKELLRDPLTLFFGLGFPLVLLVLMITEVGNPLCCFLGVMGLKAAAYLQPLLHKALERRR